MFNLTTSQKGGMVQGTNSLSIGGYKSSTLVTNDTLDNLFDEISLLTMSKKSNEYRAIMFTNTTPVTMNNVKVWINPKGDNFCKIGLNIVPTVKDAENNDWMERVSDINSKPYSGDFSYPTEVNKLNIGNIDSNQVIGIWFQRIIDEELVQKEYDNVYEPDLTLPRRFVKVEKVKEEGWDFFLEWD